MQNIANHTVPVIINADDFGYHQNINKAILQLIQNRQISSVSAIVNGAGIDDATFKIKEIITNDQSLIKQLSIGLHFNITQGPPLSKSIINSRLVQEGKFIGKPKIFDIAKLQNSFYNEQIQEQLRAQIDRFIEIFGRKPSHIDGHNHVHIIPTFAPIIAKTMNQLGIYKTRILLQKLDQINLPINHMFLKYAQQSKNSYDNNGIIYCNQFVGLQSFGNLSSVLLMKAIQNQQTQQNGSVQMMCHPGYPASEGSQWIKSSDRLQQKEQLCSQQFKNIAQKYKYRSYHDLTAKWKQGNLNILICYQGNEKIKAQKIQLSMEQLENKVRMLRWKKDVRISSKLNKIDFASLINSLHIRIIVELYCNEPAQYINQTAQNLQIPLHQINSQQIGTEQLAKLITKNIQGVSHPNFNN